MKKFIGQSNKFILASLLAVAIAGCGPKSTSSRHTPTSKGYDLEYLLKQAKQAEPTRKAGLLVEVAGLLVLEARYEKAQEILIRVDQQYLTPLQQDDFNLYYGETLLGLAAAESSLKRLNSVTNPGAKPIEWQLRYSQSLSDSYLANGNAFEAAKIRIELEDLIDNPELLQSNNEKIWQALNTIEVDFLNSLKSDFNTQRLNGWLEIVYINKKWGHDPQQLLGQMEQWKKRYPLHPSQVHQPETLQRAASATLFKPKQIAVLLPLSAKNGAVGEIIRDGILAAHYQQADAASAPRISFYDTAKDLSALTPYQKALNDGADFILGPLTKEAVSVILEQESIPVPMLALNRLQDTGFQQANIFQFGLPVEDEAVQAAHRAFEKGYRKAIAFLPENSVGERAEKAFREYFEQLGGELIEVKTYNEHKKLKADVQNLLGVDKSMDRKRAVQQLLGRNLEFEMRRRQDAEFIFLVASPSMGRSIKPFINFYYAHDLPVIATSMVYSGKKDPQDDIDLNGIEFPDIPLIISEQEDYLITRNTLKDIQPEALDSRGRFFALGYDAYKILAQLAVLRAFPDYHWQGLGGELGVDENGLVHRYLTWARFNRGVPNVTKEQPVKLQKQPLPTSSDSTGESAPSH
ncbi:penicillin-binding protein activator [Aliikangiella sp. G2MR2-5]|uniref:penicillin-binding protein activator n=1 Tax=Aliikangiella sp. G2MR2-5 TaxID=2788943 RepID=UPI0018AA6A92|nr:penicillin-binding protein activator [Aliikangiella sp. G2MR2-5]